MTALPAATAPSRMALPVEPYPGLRPFEAHEHRIFFGREEMIDAVIDGLARNNLVVVHGASGSGKSSLVRAGVLPVLEIQQGRRRSWLTAIQRPAGGPLRNLASALAGLLEPPSRVQPIDAADAWHGRLALGRTALDDIEASLCAKGASLCLLIDQFEELFRYAKETSRQEAELLIELLGVLASKGNPAPHLFVILTMRSDYLGECARFEGFAETVNSCQYLVPRLNDFALLRAIHEPAALYGGKIDTDVGDRLLFAARQEEDALPILQHTLMRACARARKRHGADRGWTVTFADLQAIEGRYGALSTHADEILGEIRAQDPGHVKAAEWVFRCLTELDAEGRVIRRPRHLGELVAVAGNSPAGVIAVIDAFRCAGRHFLIASRQGRLDDDSEIDISHEAFIRRWRQLSDPVRDPVRNEPVGWMWREFEDGQRWRALAVQARMFRDDSSKSAMLSPATTEAYESWWTERTPAWAARYARDHDSASGEYQEVEELWQASKKALELERTRREREAEAANKRLQFQYKVTAAAVFVAALIMIMAFAAWDQWRRAENEIKKSQATQSLFLASVARERRAEGDVGTALLLALEALPDFSRISRPYVAEAESQVNIALDVLSELIVLKGHASIVSSAAFSPDGRRIVTASADSTARLWDAETGQPAGTPLKGHYGFVLSAAFSPDGRRIVTASADSTARLWDAETGQPAGEPLRGHGGALWSAAFSPDGRRIVTSSADKTARLWDAETGQPIGEPLSGHDGGVLSAAFSPDGLRIVTASADGTARRWDAETGKPAGEPLTGHDGIMWSAAFSPDGRRIVTASADRTARVWDAETGKPAGEPLRGHDGFVLSAAFSPDGRRIVTASADKTARLWDVETGKPAGAPLRGHDGFVSNAAFSPDGRRIVTASADGTARLWDAAKTGEYLGYSDYYLPTGRSPDGRRIVDVSSDGIARVRDAETGKPIGEPLTGLDGFVSMAGFSPDGRRVIASAGRTARVWDADTGKPVGEPLTGHESSLWSAAFSPNGRRIVTASHDRTARVWDAETGKPIGEPLRGHNGALWSAAFSPDGRRIVTASDDGTARLWDAETGKPAGMPLTGHVDGVRSAAFSSDGRLIETVSDDGTKRLWDVETGKPMGVQLTTGYESGYAYDDTGTQALVTRAKATAPRCLTPGQRTSFSLPVEPPLWCVEEAKWPYHSGAWKEWLSEKRTGRSAPLPAAP